jgi:2-succinyl-5-enolpyruvyl-6-hydroxy-3-cyclohexene-1-carboxylate synthase
MTLGPGYIQTQWMRLLVSTLRDVGVEDFVVSPGSRNTPIISALQATGAPLHLCVDERSAAFMALGMTRVTGKPAALVCTSGTAAAHYYPAVIEASQSGLPLLMLTADRPSELHDNSSPQTINQQRLFGIHVRGFVDVGSPDSRIAALRGLRRKVAQAAALAQTPHPGPVQINVPAYKPLEPEEATSLNERQHAQEVHNLASTPPIAVEASHLSPTGATLERVVEAWNRAERPVLVCGPTSSHHEFEATARFVRHANWPVLCEVTHPLRQTLADSPQLCSSFELLARLRPASLLPDLVVTIGGTATSSAWHDWLLRHDPGPRLHAISPHSFADPLNRVELMLQSDEEALFAALTGKITPAADTWTAAWRRANTTARRLIESAFDEGKSHDVFGETEVLARIGRHLRSTDRVILGNSLPIRLAETFFLQASGYRCLSQRGTNGIDGLIAGAVGSALKHSGKTVLIVGDVSALHDVGSLQLLRNLAPNLLVCIVDNNGGRIFDELPVAKAAADLRPWTTPHQHDLSAVARAFGIPTTTITAPDELAASLGRLHDEGPRIWVCKVAPDGARRTYTELLRRLTEELTR